MNSNKVRNLVTTAVLLALALVFQNLRLLIGSNPVSTYIIASLVNLCLIIASMMVGLTSGVAIAVATPLMALLQGHAQAPMVPWIMVGNTVLVVIFAFIASRDSLGKFSAAALLSAVLKFAVIAFGNATVLAGKGNAFNVALGVAAGNQIQQLITVLIAAFIAWLIYRPIEKAAAHK